MSAQVPLVDAARTNSSADITELLRVGGDPKVGASDGTTALHWAAHHNNAALVGRLIDAGADAAAINDYGSTPMSEAAMAGNVRILEMLLDAGANVDSPNTDGQTALMIVARNENLSAARLLLDRGADVNAVEAFRGQTALMWAAAQKQPNMIAELIRDGADVDARSMVNAWARQVTGEPRAIHRPAGGLTPLLYASREGCIECTRNLIAGGADIDLADPEGVTPLIMAITNMRFDLASYLLDAGANPNNWDWWGRTPLYEAVDLNTLPHGGRTDQPSLDETTSLQIIERLLDAGVNANPILKLLPPYRSVGADRGADGMLTIGATPLLRASKGMDAPAIRLLLDAGARVDIPNSRGMLPIMAAAGLGSRDGDTRGWFATTDVQDRSIAALTVLLEAGADIDSVGDRQQQTALHGAATWGWNDVIRFLADQGADMNIADSRGLTAMASAWGRRGGRGGGAVRPETADLIESLGGEVGSPIEGGRGGFGLGVGR